MHPIRIKPLNEVILVADDVSATPHLDTDVLGLEMPAAPDRLNLARVGTQHLGAAGPGPSPRSPVWHRPPDPGDVAP